jgi:hypothetical protein
VARIDSTVDRRCPPPRDPNVFAQAHRVGAAVNPATVTEPFRRVFWWDLAAPTQDIGYPWSRKI